ncbi:polysaccharide biosynthesis protein [Pluralibacter gergoviae]|uniref:oligosaccharide flippase family protein n=1 Tax=Pluralibacter gergoviae TaxID=61647 RepID=UPI00065124BA|nr:oligosaccharide flippase family protein [Pluralibacter gergoviae]KMK01530.1 polysaccharide biosynthesis protein [Pluralibacter gergoviae]
MNRTILSNSFWMIFEKVISIFGLIFVTSFVAKYVGPSVYGAIALSLSIFQLIQIISQLGSDVIIFKRISRNERSGIKLIKTTMPLRMAIYVICSIPVLCYFYFVKASGFVFIFAAFLACFFLALDVYSIYYNARLKSKVNTVVNIIGLLISLALRWLIAYFHYPVEWLAFPIVIAPLVPFILRVLYFYSNSKFKVVSSRHKRVYRKYLLGAGSAFVFSSISVALYTRMSIFLLGIMSGQIVVGVFSVAATLSSAWSFIIYSFITSTLPSIFSEKNKKLAEIKTAKLNLTVIYISSIVILCAFFLTKPFLSIFYGPHYENAYALIIILSFSTMISALGNVSSRYIAYYSGYKFLSVKTAIIVVISLFINYFLIRFLGGIGAAFATLIIEIISLTILNYFFSNGLVFKLHLVTMKNIFRRFSMF